MGSLAATRTYTLSLEGALPSGPPTTEMALSFTAPSNLQQQGKALGKG